VQFGRSTWNFRRNLLPLSSGSKNMETVSSSETSVNVYWTTRRHISEDSKQHGITSSVFTLRTSFSAGHLAGYVHTAICWHSVQFSIHTYIYRNICMFIILYSLYFFSCCFSLPSLLPNFFT
jgi:hypothetical protein